MGGQQVKECTKSLIRVLAVVKKMVPRLVQ